MNFSWFFVKKTSINKNKKKENSIFIIFITQIVISISIIISHITFSIGIGSKKLIKEKLFDFYGHIVLIRLNNNLSIFKNQNSNLKNIFNSSIDHINSFITINSVIRMEKDIEYIVFKGISHNYDHIRLKKFLIKGQLPNLGKLLLSNEVLLSKKMANILNLDIGNYFTSYFVTSKSPYYIAKKFIISGLYETGIKHFDDVLVIGDIKQIQNINSLVDNYVNGFEIFLKNINEIHIVEKKIKKLLDYKFQVQSVFSNYEHIINWIETFDINIFIIIFIINLVAIINIITLLLVLILERIYTIGILKTLGANNWMIQKIFIYYILRIIIPSLLIGNIIGVGLLVIQKKFQWISLNLESYYMNSIPIYLDLMIIIQINLYSILICIIILTLLSFIISKISPMKSIKFD